MIKIKKFSRKMETITITFGDAVENHVGMQMIGTQLKQGLSDQDLLDSQSKLKKNGITSEIFKLDYLNEKASVLIIKNGIEQFGLDKEEMFKELRNQDWDKKAFMKGRVVNKKARYNLCIADFEQAPDYENKKGRVINFKDINQTNLLREMLPLFFNVKKLNAEGNFYYNPDCTIKYHGDFERKIVIAVRLGDMMPLYYHWYQYNVPKGKLFEFILNHGDIYVMSEKATGNDWKKSSILTLRHAAGNVPVPKYNVICLVNQSYNEKMIKEALSGVKEIKMNKKLVKITFKNEKEAQKVNENTIINKHKIKLC